MSTPTALTDGNVPTAPRVETSPRVQASPRVIRTRPRGEGNTNPTTEYSGLLSTVRDAGLLRRRRGFYSSVFSVPDARPRRRRHRLRPARRLLVPAAASPPRSGIVLTQFAFLAHEASHRQVFESGKANDGAGRILANRVVGISYSWWMNKHSRHHANPNVRRQGPGHRSGHRSRSPEEDAAQLARLSCAWLTRRQGYLFFPLLLLEGLNLHLHRFRTVASASGEGRRALRSRSRCSSSALSALPRRRLLVPAARHGLRVPRRADGRLRRLHGRLVRPEPQGHADHRPRTARSTSCAGRCSPRATSAAAAVMDYVHGRPELPGRAPPVPEHAAPAPARGARRSSRSTARRTTSPTPRPALHRVVRHRHRATSTASALAARDPFDCPAAGAYGR